MTDASEKAALARTQSKTWRFFGGVGAREASWSAARQRRFGPRNRFSRLLKDFVPLWELWDAVGARSTVDIVITLKADYLP